MLHGRFISRSESMQGEVWTIRDINEDKGQCGLAVCDAGSVVVPQPDDLWRYSLEICRRIIVIRIFRELFPVNAQDEEVQARKRVQE